MRRKLGVWTAILGFTVGGLGCQTPSRQTQTASWSRNPYSSAAEYASLASTAPPTNSWPAGHPRATAPPPRTAQSARPRLGANCFS